MGSWATRTAVAWGGITWGAARDLGLGVLWVAALLASLLSLPRLFAADFADGTLEQITLSPYPVPALIGGKIVAHWASTGLPLCRASIC